MTALFSYSVVILHFFKMLSAKDTIKPLDGGGVTCKVSLSVSLIEIDSFIWVLFKLNSKFLSICNCNCSSFYRTHLITCTTPSLFSWWRFQYLLGRIEWVQLIGQHKNPCRHSSLIIDKLNISFVVALRWSQVSSANNQSLHSRTFH